jgi:hypothetical protein
MTVKQRRQIVGSMPTNVHRVVQNPYDLDDALVRNPIMDEISSSSAAPGRMEGAQTWMGVVPRVVIGHERIVGERTERRDERLRRAGRAGGRALRDR